MGGTVVMWAVLAVLLCVAEWANPDRTRIELRSPDCRTDVGWFGLYLLYSPAVAALITAAAAVVSAHTPTPVAAAPFWVRAAVAFLVADLAAYVVHRVQHRLPALWRVHSVHHGSTALHWWSAFRIHPLDLVTAHAVPVLVATACTAEPSALAPYTAVAVVVTVFSHADVYVPANVPSVLVATPRFHRRHHECASGTSNFAVVLPVFDHLFRTASRTHTVSTYGAPRVPASGVVAQLMWGVGWSHHHDVSATPTTSDATLANALVVSATRNDTRRNTSTNSVSPTTTATSTTASAASSPIAPSRSGCATRNARGCETALTSSPVFAASRHEVCASRVSPPM